MRGFAFLLIVIGGFFIARGLFFPVEVFSDGIELNKIQVEYIKNVSDIEKIEQTLKQEENITKKYSDVPGEVHLLRLLQSEYDLMVGFAMMSAGLISFRLRRYR